MPVGCQSPYRPLRRTYKPINTKKGIEQRKGPNTKLAARPRATAFLNFTLLTRLVATSRYERLRLGACRQLGHDRVAVRAAGFRVGPGLQLRRDVERVRVPVERRGEGQHDDPEDVVDNSSKVVAHPPVTRKPVVGLHLRDVDNLRGRPESFAGLWRPAVSPNPVDASRPGSETTPQSDLRRDPVPLVGLGESAVEPRQSRSPPWALPQG